MTPSAVAAPRVVVMGVTGAGKSTVGALLATALGLPFVDGDDLHDPGSVEKMRAGIPLDDTDRARWWARINQVLRDHPDGVVVAASSLTPAARAAMTDGVTGVRFVLLHTDPATIARRVDARNGHFAGSGLLPSQLALLDPPVDAIVLDAARSPEDLVAEASTALRAGRRR
jgi:carbohydrate kinase (thermoresistant glucokinase family)